MFLLPIFFLSLPALVVLVNFIGYLINQKIICSRYLWLFIQFFTVIVLPIFFLSLFDYTLNNDCCSDSAVFSPEHRLSIYVLIILSMLSYVISSMRNAIFPPLAEVLLNTFLLIGLALNLLLFVHLGNNIDGFILPSIGNAPIIMLYIISLHKNQHMLSNHISINDIKVNGVFGTLGLLILTAKPILKYPVLTLLFIPITMSIILILLLFGQQPDSAISAFTDTYKHGFSQLDYMCKNIECGGHFLCSVGANGHKSIVKPLRYGERNGNKIICTRQLLISNAFEELLGEKLPRLHFFIRRIYNKLGNKIHKYYHVFNIKWLSDLIYILMKPLELMFLITLYLFDSKPENRIAKQYTSVK